MLMIRVDLTMDPDHTFELKKTGSGSDPRTKSGLHIRVCFIWIIRRSGKNWIRIQHFEKHESGSDLILIKFFYISNVTITMTSQIQ